MKNNMITSVTASVMLAFPVGFLLSKTFEGIGFWPMTAISAAIIFAITFPSVYLLNKSNTKRFEKAETEISDNIKFKTEGFVQKGVDKGTNAKLYFCEDKLILISLIERPYHSEIIMKNSIVNIDFDLIYVDIFTQDGDCYKITINYLAGLKEFLEADGWTEKRPG